jgi:hypothetical protein
MAGYSSCSAWIGTGFGGRRTRGGSGEGADVHVPFNGNLEAWSTSLHDARIAPGCAHRAAAARWWPSDAPPSPLQHPLPSPSRTTSVVRILEPAATTTKEKGGGPGHIGRPDLVGGGGRHARGQGGGGSIVEGVGGGRERT